MEEKESSSTMKNMEEKQQQQQQHEEEEEEEEFSQSLQPSKNLLEGEGRRSESSVRRPTPNENSSITFFSRDDIERATNGFSDFYSIGQERDWHVYRGYLDYTIEVTIKMLDSKSYQDLVQFVQKFLHITNDLNDWCKIEQEEYGIIRQPKFVKLIGVCNQHSRIYLVYELLPNGSVEDCLHKNPSILMWQMRARIISEMCSALTFLHSRNLVHGDIRPANIHLDASFSSKLADFGLFDLVPKRTTASAFLDTRPQGTLGYIDPEFQETGILTAACDFYSFGITIMRLMTGKETFQIVRSVRKSRGRWTGMKVDPTAGEWNPQLSLLLSDFSLKCCRKNRKRNPDHMEEIRQDVGKLLEEIDSILEEEKQKQREKVEETIRIETCGTSSVKMFSYSDIKSATNGLSDSSKIGQGGYGSVYKGYLDDNTEVAIKMLDTGGMQGSKESIQELEVLGQMRHPNLVKLIGACFTHHSLVYKFLPNGSLEDFLKSSPRLLTWKMRVRIVYEICSALIFLHSNKPQSLVHGDLKPANILLDANFNSKLADFGLCHFLPEGTNTGKFHHTRNIQGTKWYIDLDFLETGNLSPRCDVYSFGVTILRILTEKSPAGIVMRVYAANEEKSLMTMVDFTAGPWPIDVAEYLARIGLKCCDAKRGSSALMMEISSRLKKILRQKLRYPILIKLD